MQIIAKKRFGQHFLKDENIIEQIIHSMPNSSNVVVEIGPGLGDLTKRLLEKRDVVAYEIDNELCALLQERFKKEIKEKRLLLCCTDILGRFKKKPLIEKKYDLVANLPYYIATKIILEALRDGNCQNMLVMVQKEVGEKFAANVNHRQFSALSVLAQKCGEVKKVFDIEPAGFVPKPKVHSSVLLIEKRKSLEEKGFERFLKVCFAFARKTLFSNLAKQYSKKDIKEIFEKLEISPLVRPHQVATSVYERLYNFLNKGKIDG
jgi:16S rRNA (adenine1518-N6/adenine1519-N6)-dimethyltransferase